MNKFAEKVGGISVQCSKCGRWVKRTLAGRIVKCFDCKAERSKDFSRRWRQRSKDKNLKDNTMEEETMTPEENGEMTPEEATPEVE